MTVGSFALAAVLLGSALWLFTADIHSDTGEQYPGESETETESSFCGSAYDVILLKGDGYMGGEVPVNQAQLDEECVRKAGLSVAVASALGALGLGAGVLAIRTGVRGRRDRTDVTDDQQVHGMAAERQAQQRYRDSSGSGI